MTCIMQKKYFSFKKIIISILLVIGFIAGLWIYQSQYADGIRDYNPKYDRSFILSLFKKDLYWLVSEYSTDFSAEYMLDNKLISKSNKNKGNLFIKTYYAHRKPVGFVAYLISSLYEGQVLFLAVDSQERSHGYARKLLSYALQELKKLGCVSAKMATRTHNTAAIKLYKSFGFKEVRNDGAFIWFRRSLV